jgi:hypothetical protein
MEKLKNTAKAGWHPPGKNGGKESWRGDMKGINQVVRLPSPFLPNFSTLHPLILTTFLNPRQAG